MKTVSLCLYLMIACMAIHAQEKLLRKRCNTTTLNYEQGLLLNEITGLATDAGGFAWTTTLIGLQRYNGYRFVRVNPIIENYGQITIDYPSQLFRLATGDLLIACREGLVKYVYNDDKFTMLIKSSVGSVGNINIIPLYEYNQSIICINKTEGLIGYDKTNGTKNILGPKHISISNDSIAKTESVHRNIFQGNIEAVAIGNKVYFSDQQHLYKTDVNLSTFSQEKIPAPIYGIASHDTLLVIMSNDHIALLDTKRDIIIRKIFYSAFTNEKIDAAAICKINNNFLFTINGHLYETNVNFGSTKEIYDLRNQKPVQVGFTHKIIPDQMNRVWLITNNDIRRLQYADVPFEHFYYSQAKNNFIKSIYVDTVAKVVLAGCFNGGLQLYNLQGRELLEQPLLHEETKDIMVISKLFDNNYLIETYFKGWFIFNLSSRTFSEVKFLDNNFAPAKNVSFSNNTVMLPNNRLLIATADNVYECTFDKQTLIKAEPLFAKITTAEGAYSAVLRMRTGAIVAATNTGMVYTRQQGKITHYSITGNYGIRAMGESRNGNLWVGSIKGLYLFDAQGKLLKWFTTEMGLTNDCIYSILAADVEDAVYVSTNLGLSYVSASGKIINYPREVGLQENEFNTGSCFKTADGSYYFGGINGITRFKPSRISAIIDNPQLHITSLVVNDSVYASSAGIFLNNNLELSHEENHLQFDFAAIGMLNPTEYNYSYKLEGFEKNWQHTSLPRNIRYTLNPGTYVLQLKSSPVQNAQKIFTRNINITIASPWYATWWFYALCVLSVAVLVYTFYMIRLSQVRKFYEIRMAIARDLHDDVGAALSSVLMGTQLIKRNVDNSNTKVQKIIDTMNTASSQAISNMSDIVWSLNPEHDEGSTLQVRMKKIIAELLDPQHVTVTFDIAVAINELVLPMIVTRNILLIFKEAINNLSKYSNASTVHISVELIQSKMVLLIRDNGRGFDINATTTGNGLKNMVNRSQKINGEINVHSAPGFGTTITLQVPLA